MGVCERGIPSGECTPPEERCGGGDEDCDMLVDEPPLDCGHSHAIVCQLGLRMRPDMTLERNVVSNVVGGGPGLVCAGGACQSFWDHCETLPGGVDGHVHNVTFSGSGALSFPDDTPWTPAVLECGRPGHATPQEAAHPTWKALGATFEEPSLYQLRFTATAQGYELLARTDADCDGLYEVLRRTGSVGYSGLSSDPVKMDNPGE